jgi:hypothetical protein
MASVVIGGLLASILLALPAMLLQVAKRDEAEAAPATDEVPSSAPAGSLAEPG